MWTDLNYEHDEQGDILLPRVAPFDGKPVLIKTNTGIVEAWWDHGEVRTDHEGNDDSTGFEWVCYDSEFTCELDDVKCWMPIPGNVQELPDNIRIWSHFPIQMPLNADGEGPAAVGDDAVDIAYEVWDQVLTSHNTFGNLADAINCAMRLTKEELKGTTESAVRYQQALKEISKVKNGG